MEKSRRAGVELRAGDPFCRCEQHDEDRPQGARRRLVARQGWRPVKEACGASPRGWRTLTRELALEIVALCILTSGCTYSSQLVPTQPSAITQQLVVRSLERALTQLDLTGFVGRRVTLDLFTQTANQTMIGPPQAGSQAFVKEFVTAWLEAHGVRVTPESVELKLKIAASVLGTDRGETFFGIHAFQIPVLAIPFPEVSLFKWIRNRGLAEIWVYALYEETDTFVRAIPPGIGRSKQDDFTILLIIDFTVSDVDERPQPGAQSR
jgi:hypothetical protein